MSSLVATLETRFGWPAVMLCGVLFVTLAVISNGLAGLTGIALVALGAAGALVERTAVARRADYLLLHTVIYGTLYVLCFASKLDAGGPLPLLLADIAGSVFAMCALATLLRAKLRV